MAAPSQGAAETRRLRGGTESRRRQVPAVLTQAAQSQVDTAEVTVGRRVQATAPSRSGVDSDCAESTQRRVAADTSRRCRVKALQKPGGGAESRRCRVPAVLTQAAPSPRSANTRRRCRFMALQRPGGGAESRRCRVPAVLTQAAPSPRSANTRRRRRFMALQRPGGGAESRRRRVPAVLTQAAPSQVTQVGTAKITVGR